jgi:hypothetical protein
MDGGKEALEDFAREAVGLYGGDAPKLLLHRAEIDDGYGDHSSAKTWREVAAIASRIVRRLNDQTKPTPVRPEPLPAPRQISKPKHVTRKKRSRRR